MRMNRNESRRSLRVTLISLAASFAACSGATARASVVYVTNFNSGTISAIPSGGGTPTTFATGLNSPEGIVITPTGTMYVDNQVTGVIDSVSPTGVVTPFVTIAGGKTFSGLTCDTAGNLYVSVQNSGLIDRITPSGAVSTYATGINGPQGLAFDRAGNLFVANGSVVARVAPGGGAATTFANLSGVLGIATDAAGDVFASSFSGYVEEFTPTGADLGRYSTVASAYGLEFDSADNLLVTNDGSNVYAIPPGGGTATIYATGLSGSLYLATAVPEPTGLSLLAMSGLTLLRRRRR